MTRFKKQVFAVISASVLLLNASTVYASTTIEISGNGASSDNDAQAVVSSTTTVVQSNNANVTNYVNADSDTGNNDANYNTGGDVSIETGDATTDVDVSNHLNKNSAEVNCCEVGDTDVLISGNGAESDNDVKLAQTSETEVFQNNNARVDNRIDADSDTGKNDANSNTGGSVSITTGDATTMVDVSTMANANIANISSDGEGNGSLSARILGNGAKSDNYIELELERSNLLVQENFANVDNYIYADADTGKNDANYNTGGDVSIETGDATVDVEVDNMVNFNWADLDCGCLLDVLAKIAGNGYNSDNDIKAKLTDTREVFQDNCGKDNFRWDWERGSKKCELDNHVDADSDTGKNDADKNTGRPDGDPSIETGDADSNVDIENSGNVNMLGADNGFEFPEFDFNLNFTFDLSDLLALLMEDA